MADAVVVVVVGGDVRGDGFYFLEAVGHGDAVAGHADETFVVHAVAEAQCLGHWDA